MKNPQRRYPINYQKSPIFKRTWAAFLNMHQRCLNPRHPRYRRYGARGISICDRWLRRFENFLLDMAICPPGYTLERIDNDGNYEPGNVKWATRKEQQYNRSNTIRIVMNNNTYTIPSFANAYGMPIKLLRARLSSNWTPLEIIAGTRNVLPVKKRLRSPRLILTTTRQERRALAIELRTLGESFRVISELFGVSHQAIKQMVDYQPRVRKDSWRKRLRREIEARREMKKWKNYTSVRLSLEKDSTGMPSTSL